MIRGAEERTFLVLVIGVSIGLMLLLQPFFGPILWAAVAALMFEPVMCRISHQVGNRRSASAALTLLVIILLVVVPALLLILAIIDEVTAIYERIATGGFHPEQFVRHLQGLMPKWLPELLSRAGLNDLDALRERITGTLASALQVTATKFLDIGQSAFGFIIALGVMLYLTFFFLRDGRRIVGHIEDALPLNEELRDALFARIVTVVRATIKGSFAVAAAQGLAGGLLFWALGIEGALLWGIAMGFFSLLPAIGSGIVWVPVALYLLATGAIAKAIILALCGMLVIGSIDNVLRPILVGRDTQLPDYVIFLSTIGGLSLFGFNGLVVGPVIASLFLAVWDIFGQMQKRV